MIDKKPFASLKYILACINPLANTILALEDMSGLKLHAYKRDVIGRAIFKTGHYDRHISKWLKNKFESLENGIFIDVGANIGYYSCLFSKISGRKGLVLSFEPEPENIALLNKNIDENDIKNITVMPMALGPKNGNIELNIYKASNRGRHSVVSALNSHQKITVPVVRLDDVASKYLDVSKRISCLKIDVEGFEAEVLKGAQDTLKRVDCLLIEYAPYLLNQSPNGVDSLLDILSETFGKFHTIEDGGIIKPISIEEMRVLDFSVDVLCEN